MAGIIGCNEGGGGTRVKDSIVISTRGWDYDSRIAKRTWFYIMQGISCGPDLSSVYPETAGCAAALHVREGGSVNMAGCFFGVANGTGVGTVAMGPAVLAGGGLGGTTASTTMLSGAIIVAIATSATASWSIGAGISRSGGVTHERHHLLHLSEEGLLASLEVRFALLKQIGLFNGDRCGCGLIRRLDGC